MKPLTRAVSYCLRSEALEALSVRSSGPYQLVPCRSTLGENGPLGSMYISAGIRSPLGET